jgi:hypothetical protein
MVTAVTQMIHPMSMWVALIWTASDVIIIMTWLQTASFDA